MPRNASQPRRQRDSAPASREAPSAKARAMRIVAAVALLGVWVGLTATTRADPAGARPGMSVSVAPPPESLPHNASARQLARLLAATEDVPSAKNLHAALESASGHVGLDLPASQRKEDSAHDAPGQPVALARQGLTLSAALTRDALKAPQDQSAHLLVAAAEIDDAARASLQANKSAVPKNSGVAAALGLSSSTGLTGLTGAQQKSLRSALKTASCSAGHDGLGRLPDAVVGFADDPVADSKAAASRGRAFHAAGAEAGRLAYATRVIGQRQGSASQLAQADELDDLVDELQSLMPSDCSPLATTSVGATKSLTGATGTLTAGRTALADRLLTAASSMPGGASRQSLARLWWQLR